MLAFLISLPSLCLQSGNFLWRKLRGLGGDGRLILRSAQEHHKIHALGTNMYLSLQQIKFFFKIPPNNSLTLIALPPIHGIKKVDCTIMLFDVIGKGAVLSCQGLCVTQTQQSGQGRSEVCPA